MISKSRKLIHPAGHTLDTPLLVPSYSSKGFKIIKDKSGNEKSEISQVMKTCRQFLTEILLVSAYDIHYEYIPDAPEFVSTDIVIIDSGGYETSNNFDFPTVKKFSDGGKSWKLEDYEKVLNDWPEEYPKIIVSFDKGYQNNPINDQVSHAKTLFAKYPDSINDFLIKPLSDDASFLNIDTICNEINLLKGFDIIGFTEVELGNSIQERMKRIIKIRKTLEGAGLEIPIHIFGSLDPITSLLYFLAGADIFDGLTWIRYAYYKGKAIYPANFGFLDNQLGIHLRDVQIQTQQLFLNLASLLKLKDLMQRYVNTGEFEVFNELGIDGLSTKLDDIMKNLTN